MSSDTIHKTIFLDAPIEMVWGFLTEKDKLALWFHEADQDLAEGKPYTLLHSKGDKACWGNVLKMDAPNELVYSFTISPLNGKMTTVSWALEEMAGGTRLTLKHTGIAAAVSGSPMSLLMALDVGWDKHFAGLREQFTS